MADVEKDNLQEERPDVTAAIRGGDIAQGMEGEHDIGTATLQQAMFWRDTYREILTLEEGVLARVHELMAPKSAAARREVELSNVPVIAAQVERFRARLGYWEDRLQVLHLNGASPPPVT